MKNTPLCSNFNLLSRRSNSSSKHIFFVLNFFFFLHFFLASYMDVVYCFPPVRKHKLVVFFKLKYFPYNPFPKVEIGLR